MSDTQLKSYIDRIENVESEVRDRKQDIKDIYTEAKNSGYDTKILRKVIQLRRIDADERERMQAEIDTYMEALGRT